MAVFTYTWQSLPRTSLDPSYGATSADIDDVYVDLPVEAQSRLSKVSFGGSTAAYYHAHSGSSTMLVYIRNKADASWHQIYALTTSGSQSIAGLSIDVPANLSFTVDAVRLGGSPYQATAYHNMATEFTLSVETMVASSGGGGGGSGTGNLVGAFAVGSTMLGAEPGGGGGGGGGAGGTGNLIGAFGVGSTMVGAEPGGGGGSDVPMAPGSPQPLAASIGGVAQVGGAFQTFVWETAGRPAGVAGVVGYLNANWPLAGTTANTANGVTIYRTVYPTGTQLDPTSGQVQGVPSQTGTWYFKIGTSTGTNTYGTAYKTNIATGVETTISGFGSGGATSFSWDAGAGHFISRVDLRDSSNRLVARWEWSTEPTAAVRGLIDSPIGLLANSPGPVGEATVAADLSQHVLRGERSQGAAEVSGQIAVAIPLRSTVVAGNATVGASMGVVVPLEGSSAAGSTVAANLDQYISPGLAAGESVVEADLTHSVLSGQTSGSAEVKAGLSTDASVQGGDSHGTSSVTGHATHYAQVAGQSDGVTMRVLADLGRTQIFPPAQANGISTVVGNVEITLLDARGDGGAAGNSDVAAHLGFEGGILNFGGAVAGEAAVTGEPRVRGRIIPQPIVGTSTASADQITRVWFVEGKAEGDSTCAVADIRIHYPSPTPIVCDSTVEGHASHDARYGGEIVGEAKVLPTFPYVETSFGTVQSDGDSSARGRMAVKPQDFDESTSSGSSAVIGQVLVSDLSLFAKVDEAGRHPILAVGQDGKPVLDERGQQKRTGHNNTLVTAHMSFKFFFEGRSVAEATAAVTFAILLLNDSGLIFGGSINRATMDFKTGVGAGQANGFSRNRGQFDFARDMRAECKDAYSGVGKWFPGGFYKVHHYDYSLTMAPIKDVLPPGHDPNEPYHGAHHHGASRSDYFGVSSARNPTIDSYIDGHVWDGTYEEWTANDVRGLKLENFPELIDPETGRPYPKFPGPLRRKYQLLQPGTPGTWMVDTRGPGFMDKAMRADSVGEARFDEPQSTVDMDLELKSSMKGRIVCGADVLAAALILSYRKYLVEGNVTAVRSFIQEIDGMLAKSPEALLPMTRESAEALKRVNQTTAMYV